MDMMAAQGLSLGVLGGFRAIAADLVWLKTYVAWEARDIQATESLLQLATALDDRPLCFWLNGARMMAYDIPAWRIDEVHRAGPISETERRHIGESQARRALAFLERGTLCHPTTSAFWIERANIELNCLHDAASAAESYRRASEQPDAPYFPARIHAELLRRQGLKVEALAWLVQLYPTLPTHVEAAAAPLVLSRIRELENELSIAPRARFTLLKPEAAGRDRTLTPFNAPR